MKVDWVVKKFLLSVNNFFDVSVQVVGRVFRIKLLTLHQKILERQVVGELRKQTVQARSVAFFAENVLIPV